MKSRLAVFSLVVLILSAVMVSAQNQGKEKIILKGGKMGDITFPHHQHHAAVEDCRTCHKDFAKEPGALLASQKAGTLKKKQVMNKTCLKCHRDRKKAGQAYGPVKCSGCHIK